MELLFTEVNLRILTIFIVAFVAWLVIQTLTKSFVLAVSVGTPRGKRLRTLTNLVKSTASVVIVTIATFMILQEVGFNVAPLLASAGVVGLAVGFGAQTLVKDVISGFFLLVEDQFDEGDEVEISGKKGVVKKITLRTIWLEDKEGTMHIIPNGTITMISNFSKK
jgi:small conductance mechanosensitive channel